MRNLSSLFFCVVLSCGGSQHKGNTIYEVSRFSLEEIDKAVSDFYQSRHNDCLRISDKMETYKSCMDRAEQTAFTLNLLHSAVYQVYEEDSNPCQLAPLIEQLQSLFTHSAVERLVTLVKEQCK